MTEGQQHSSTTTDSDLYQIENYIAIGSWEMAQAAISYHQLIQTRRLASAAERQATALEAINERQTGSWEKPQPCDCESCDDCDELWRLARAVLYERHNPDGGSADYQMSIQELMAYVREHTP